MFARRKNAAVSWNWYDRLRGNSKIISSDSFGAETDNSGTAAHQFTMDGFSTSGTSDLNGVSIPYGNWFFKRAPGFFDIVCYTGARGEHTISHGLGCCAGTNAC